MSKTMVVGPIIAALVKSEDILGKDRKWEAIDDTQAHFLKQFFSKRDELKVFSEKELRNWASWVAAELNEILEKEGFDIRLEKFRKDEFGVVSILDVLVEWLMKGERSQLRVDGKDYPAVKMELTAGFIPYASSRHRHPIAILDTKSGDTVYMTIADKPYQDFDLISRIDKIRSNLQLGEMYDYLKFPMVDLNQEVDISWLKQMWTINDNSGQKALICQALQQTKFKMNELGARVKSAVATGFFVLGVREKQTLLIDKPFFLWIERKGISIPVMYAYVDERDWKDPSDLSDM